MNLNQRTIQIAIYNHLNTQQSRSQDSLSKVQLIQPKFNNQQRRRSLSRKSNKRNTPKSSSISRKQAQNVDRLTNIYITNPKILRDRQSYSLGRVFQRDQSINARTKSIQHSQNNINIAIKYQQNGRYNQQSKDQQRVSKSKQSTRRKYHSRNHQRKYYDSSGNTLAFFQAEENIRKMQKEFNRQYFAKARKHIKNAFQRQNAKFNKVGLISDYKVSQQRYRSVINDRKKTFQEQGQSIKRSSRSVAKQFKLKQLQVQAQGNQQNRTNRWYQNKGDRIKRQKFMQTKIIDKHHYQQAKKVYITIKNFQKMKQTRYKTVKQQGHHDIDDFNELQGLNNQQQCNVQQNQRKQLSSPKHSAIINRNQSGNNFGTIQKIFIFNSKDYFIKNALIHFGWKQAHPGSPYYTLKWSYKEQFMQYQFLKNKNRKSKNLFRTKGNPTKKSLQRQTDVCVRKYYNHIKNNSMVTKVGIKNIAERISSKKKSNQAAFQFIPRSYDLKMQYQQFVKDFQQTAIFNILKTHQKYFLVKSEDKKLFDILEQEEHKMLSPSGILQKLKTEKINKIVSQQRNQQFVVNIPLLMYALIHAQFIITQNKSQIKQQVYSFTSKFQSILKNTKIMNMLVKYSRIQHPFQYYKKQRNTSGLGESINETNRDSSQKISLLQIKEDYIIKINWQGSFLTPSLQIILCVLKANKNLSQIYGLRCKADGQKNLWILKHSLGSKGKGIKIVDRIEQIKQASDHQTTQNKIVQKYIQSIWILSQKTLSNMITPEQQRIKLRQSSIFDKKFDIRQWVLICYPHSYIFSHFYLKVCSKSYDLKQLNKVEGHLSNFSVNRLAFSQNSSRQFSVMSEQDFGSIIETIYPNKMKLQQMKSKIKQAIGQIIEQGAVQFQKSIPGCFQLLGFDIIMDEQLNPWVLEANMSPACQQRASWLTEMSNQMGKELLRVVLPSDLLTKCQASSQYKWILMNGNQSKDNSQYSVKDNQY